MLCEFQSENLIFFFISISGPSRIPQVSPLGLFGDIEESGASTSTAAICKTPNKSLRTPPKPLEESVANTPKRRKTLLRERSELGGEEHALPRVFDEAAMFLGDDEFFLHTNTPPHRLALRSLLLTLNPCGIRVVHI